MDLYTQNPYWLLSNAIENSRPALTKSISCDIAIIGGGITGALTAYILAEDGHDVVVLEKRHAGMGSTCASTALLQYEIDEPLHTLRDKVGTNRADTAYIACHHAIDTLQSISCELGVETGFEKVPSLQYASWQKDLELLEKEAEARDQIGLRTDLLDDRELFQRFGLNAPGALYTAQGGQVDPFRLTMALLDSFDNIQVFDTCEIASLSHKKRMVECTTRTGRTIYARRVIVACGYESRQFTKQRVVDLGTTFSCVSRQMSDDLLWPGHALLWETKSPYLYARCTADGRIMVGGRDSEWTSPAKRKKALPSKIRNLTADMRKIFEDIEFDVDFAWAGMFGTTRDSLGYVGQTGEVPNVYFNLGFGGNGILYSLIGAEIIRDSLKSKKHACADAFAFERVQHT